MGAASGRVDAIAFMLGIVAGVWAFAEAWIALEHFVGAGAVESATLSDLLGVPFQAVALALLALAIGMAWLLRKLEAGRRRGVST